MSKELIVSATSLESKVAILEDDQVTEIFIEREKNKGILGNIYKGKVTKVLPGMQAAFVHIGLERHAFLYVADILEDFEGYEELFSGDQGVEHVLLDGTDVESRLPKRRKQGSQARAARPEDKTPVGSSGTADSVTPRNSEFPLAPPPPPIPPFAAGSILPEDLELIVAPAPDSAPEPDLAPGDAPGSRILPERLETVVHLEPERASGDDLPDRTIVLREEPEQPRLATRSESRSNRRRNRGNNGQPLIGDLLREGQEILVQVAKEPIGKKGPRITSHVALPGRYLVYMPTVNHVGVSRKISSDKERIRLRETVLRLRGDFERGFIVRTAGENHREEEFASDMAYLTRLWEEVRSRAERRSAPALIHAEPSLVQRVIRDYVTDDFRAIRVDDEQEYARIVEFVSTFNPRLVAKVRLFNKRTHIFDEFGIKTEIEKALKHKVWLKNGGHIVINQTEALVAIDVNTGKYVGRTASLEDTITKTNLDAVREVVRQIRLRDLGGIIVIDFIDMDDSRNRQRVLEALQAELAKDKSPSKILRFNEFGLVALTRKRVKQSLEKVLCQPCIFCSGTGMTKSTRTIAYAIHQEVSRMAPDLGEGQELLVRCHPAVAKALRGVESDVVAKIEEMSGRIVSVKSDPLMHIEQFDVVEV